MSKLETKISNRLTAAEAQVREGIAHLSGIASTIVSGEQVELGMSSEELFNKVKSHIAVLNQQAMEIRELNQQISSRKVATPA